MAETNELRTGNFKMWFLSGWRFDIQLIFEGFGYSLAIPRW
jgi:hypothetical protein